MEKLLAFPGMATTQETERSAETLRCIFEGGTAAVSFASPPSSQRLRLLGELSKTNATPRRERSTRKNIMTRDERVGE